MTRATKIIRMLEKEYRDAGTSLEMKDDPFRFLVSVMLSAQCTDAKVNRVAPRLFAIYPRPEDLSSAPLSKLEEILKPLGLYKVKARHARAAARAAIEGIDWCMEGLQKIPGVGRKTANVVLTELRGRSGGIAVDTHCMRLARRLGISAGKDAAEIERDLMREIPEEKWPKVTHLFIAHGRKICRARKPSCGSCVIARLCPSRNLIASAAANKPIAEVRGRINEA